MKTCICGRTKIMRNTHRVGVIVDNIVRYTASSLTVLQHSLPQGLSALPGMIPVERQIYIGCE